MKEGDRGSCPPAPLSLNFQDTGLACGLLAASALQMRNLSGFLWAPRLQQFSLVRGLGTVRLRATGMSNSCLRKVLRKAITSR